VISIVHEADSRLCNKMLMMISLAVRLPGYEKILKLRLP
jgi:hypothetical protein